MTYGKKHFYWNLLWLTAGICWWCNLIMALDVKSSAMIIKYSWCPGFCILLLVRVFLNFFKMVAKTQRAVLRRAKSERNHWNETKWQKFSNEEWKYFAASEKDSWFPYTGGILQWLDTDVHSAVTAKMSTALWQRKWTQRCDSDGVDSNVAALTVRALMTH